MIIYREDRAIRTHITHNGDMWAEGATLWPLGAVFDPHLSTIHKRYMIIEMVWGDVYAWHKL